MKISNILIILSLCSIIAYVVSSNSNTEEELLEAKVINSTLASLLNGNPEELFSTYLRLYKKDYLLSSEEGEKRFKIFMERVRYINEHNADKTKTWTIGLDQFSDLTKEEFKKNHLMDPEILKKERENLEAEYFTLNGLNVVEYMPEKAAMIYRPIDWSSKTGKTYAQGLCGCCYAMSTVNAMETNYAISTGLPYIAYSRQQIIDCSIYSHGCDGGDKRIVVGYANLYGMIPESLYPYAEKVQTCKYPTLKDNNRVLCNGMETINDTISKENCGKAGLYDALSRGVVVISVDGDALQGYKGGILDLRGKCVESNHAVMLTGFGVENGVEYWLVKNSWGVTHGYNGYYKARVFDDPNDFQYNCYMQCGFMRPFLERRK